MVVRADREEYAFFTLPAATVRIGVQRSPDWRPMLLITGNRAGIVSLGGIVLWFWANSVRREFLSVADLPFVQLDHGLSLIIRSAPTPTPHRFGAIIGAGGGEQLEWLIFEDELEALASQIYALGSVPENEYIRLHLGDDSMLDVEVRMLDASEWI